MKSVRYFQKCAVAAIVAASQGQVIAMAQSALPESSSLANKTTSARQDQMVSSDERHWRSFLELAAIPNASVTLADLKRAFPREAITSTLPGVYEVHGVLRYSVSAAPRMQHLYPGRNQIYITLYFHNIDSTTCPSKDKLVSDLQKVGWEIFSNLPERAEGGVDGVQLHLPSEARLKRGDQGILSLVYSNDCPRDVFLEADKVRFDEISSIHASKDSGQ
jgi:hypothetical protein